MDDLEHSVFMAERDWTCFCEESEECSIQQAGLAGLDDSGLSDSDDDRRSAQEPVLPLQTNPDEPDEEPGAAAQTQDKAEDRNARHRSQHSEHFCCETDRGRRAEHAAQISLNANVVTHTCLTTDCSVSGSDTAPTEWQHKTSYKECVQDHNQCHGESKMGQATGELVSITSAPTTQATGSGGSSEFTMVMGSSATPKKEKERWFVTVNDSPVHQRKHHGTPGQKKRRKKKRSKRSGVTKWLCALSTKDREAGEDEINAGQEHQHTFQQPLQRCSKHLYFNRSPGNGNEEVISGSANTPKEVLSPIKEPEVVKCERSSVTSIDFTLAAQTSAAKAGNSRRADFPADKPGNKCFISLKSPAANILAQNLQLQTDVLNDPMTQLAYDQNTFSQCESNTATNEEEEHPSLSENQESTNESLEAAVSPSHPIYALSSFWDEMEKLTINDILHLRVSNNKSPLQGKANLEESDVQYRCLENSKDESLQDCSLTDDTADSDYFTHLDDSKPDRSSCEFSACSDFDEDILQSANPSPEPQNVKEFTNTQDLLLGQEAELMIINSKREAEDIILICPPDGVPLYLGPAAETQSSFLASDQDCSGRPFQREAFRKTPSPVLSVVNTLDDNYLVPLSDIFTKDIGEGLETRGVDGHSSVISFPYPQHLSVPEMYDDFFSDFEVANVFFPSLQNKMIPIFSFPHAVVGDLVMPEAEELWESDTENQHSQLQAMTRFSSQPKRSTSNSANISFFTNQRRNWSSILSLRKVRFMGKGRTWCQKISSWIFPQEAKEETSYISNIQSVSPLLPLEGKALVQFVEQQEDFRHAVSISTREGFLLSIGQADMCLFCIAFASWVLKSSNPQSADMWKAALLANVSAISAIQYLRQYTKRETSNYDP
ncbi:uncharacterized protein perm1b [Brachyhypopomus gauderio]|uniref:uncharacterized protein perm1b n=1 Tax=Brachyhypopomus gauderio TaxID=698409 RepID=UPI004040EE93